MQVRKLLSFFATYCVMANLFFFFFLTSCFPACTGGWDCSSAGAGLSISFYWTSWDSCCPISLFCWVPSEWQCDHQMLSNISPSSVSLANLLRVQPFLSSRLMMKILNNFVPSDNPLYYTPSDWPPTGQQITALWAKFFISFQSIRATSLPTSTKLVI